MASEDTPDSDAAGDTREQGVEFGELKGELDAHAYPTTGEELLAAYGDFEIGLTGGSTTLGEVLGGRHDEQGGEEVRYESADDVHQSILNMVGSDAVGRENYTDRGGSQEMEVEDGRDQDKDSL